MIVRVAAFLLACAIPGTALAQDAGHGTHDMTAPDGQTAPGDERPKRMAAPKDARAYIIWPSNGTVINGGKFWVRMGLQNYGVAPAGVRREGTGHHHLIIDSELPPLDEPIPNDRNHLHFGGGQTEARVELPPGQHTLQMLLGDADHVPHDPPVTSSKITITVR
ncbi:twin-arginine translocation pathway signal [Skermanella stibiiresistens SB22]|uniref:Twin-arginine translocation pathway signal n=1 Tax=Skermanella stibiiresistens SB22 TaxID=1385369 RepID=W9GZV3_9PROT|nr:DUF4399 domain-containing protein [Skermanella stibiiresistens]EWY37992.1 twin-arginine translocation pathway signal [Skermanella stibiiresistens SB22]